MRRLVLGIAVAVTSLMPVVGMADDQQIADFIKSRLQAEQQQGNLRGFNVDMRVEQGTVWFKGHVSTSEQEMTILRTAQRAGHLGVVQVVDDIEIIPVAAAQVPAKQVAFQEQVAQPVPQQIAAQQIANQQIPAQQIPNQQIINQQIPAQQVSNNYRMPVGNQPMPINNPPMPLGVPAQQVGAPMPAGMGGGMGMTAEAPQLPGYAWPGYAAHPNFGNVTYPQQYSPSAWPYIGPFYPYPQVPLGWRKVSLEWDDGWWMLDFHNK